MDIASLKYFANTTITLLEEYYIWLNITQNSRNIMEHNLDRHTRGLLLELDANYLVYWIYILREIYYKIGFLFYVLKIKWNTIQRVLCEQLYYYGLKRCWNSQFRCSSIQWCAFNPKNLNINESLGAWINWLQITSRTNVFKWLAGVSLKI